MIQSISYYFIINFLSIFLQRLYYQERKYMDKKIQTNQNPTQRSAENIFVC